MKSHPPSLKSIAIAQIAAAVANLEGGVGPFGGDAAELDENTVTFWSQAGTNTYEFHDDGTVDLVNVEEAYGDLVSSIGCEEDEAEDAISTLDEFKAENTNLAFEAFMSNGWFDGSEIEKKAIELVKLITEGGKRK